MQTVTTIGLDTAKSAWPNFRYWHLADMFQTGAAAMVLPGQGDDAPFRDIGLVWIVSPMAMREVDCRSRVLGSAQEHVLRSAGTGDEAHNQGGPNHVAQHLGRFNRSACSHSRGGLRGASTRRGCSLAPCACLR